MIVGSIEDGRPSADAVAFGCPISLSDGETSLVDSLNITKNGVPPKIAGGIGVRASITPYFPDSSGAMTALGGGGTATIVTYDYTTKAYGTSECTLTKHEMQYGPTTYDVDFVMPTLPQDGTTDDVCSVWLMIVPAAS